RGREQHRTDYLVAKQFRMLIGQRHHGHPAHGVADQDYRLVAGRGRHHYLVQVGTELVDADQVGVGPTGPAVAALIPEHAPRGSAEPRPLVVPDIGVERVAMAEDDRDRSVRRTTDLDVQRQAVV